MRSPRLVLHSVALGLVSALAACGSPSNDDHESGLKQLVNNDFACSASSSRIAGLKDRYGQYLIGGTATQQQDAWNALSELPSEYLHWVFDRNQVPVTLKGETGSTRGVTSSIGDSNGWRPQSIWVAQKSGNFNALPHEMGHATEHYLAKSFSGFDSELAALFSQVQQNGEAQYMRGYAKSSQTEFIAELFDSYYCSPESRAHMADKMPSTLAFAKRFLIDPTKLDTGKSGETPRGKELGVDMDNDSVTNPYDVCPATGVNAADMRFDAKFSGCSGAQIGNSDDNDDDGDGIADSEDRCPGTQAGATVWKQTTGPNAKWLGCTQGQVPG